MQLNVNFIYNLYIIRKRKFWRFQQNYSHIFNVNNTVFENKHLTFSSNTYLHQQLQTIRMERESQQAECRRRII